MGEAVRQDAPAAPPADGSSTGARVDLDRPLLGQALLLMRRKSLIFSSLALVAYMIAFGFLIELMFRHNEYEARLLLFEDDELRRGLPFVVLWAGIVLAIQPDRSGMATALHALAKNGVVDTTPADGAFELFVARARRAHLLSRSRTPAYFAALAIAAGGLMMVFEAPLWLWFVLINLVGVVMVLIRQLYTTAVLLSLFQSFDVTPRPMHQDRCAGLAPIGHYAKNTSITTLLLWVYAFGMLFLVALCVCRYELVEFFLANILVQSLVLLPCLFVFLVWGVHDFMAEKKERALASMSMPIQLLLLDPATENDLASLDKLDKMSARYDLVKREYATWPFRVAGQKRLITLAGLAGPVATAVVRIKESL